MLHESRRQRANEMMLALAQAIECGDMDEALLVYSLLGVLLTSTLPLGPNFGSTEYLKEFRSRVTA